MIKTFEEFLQIEHCNQYEGIKDNIIDDFERWICELSADEWLEYGEEWADYKLQNGTITIKINK